MKRKPLTDPPDKLTLDERKRLLEWATSHWPRIGPHLGRHWVECRDWHLSRGVMRANWEATFRNWLRQASKFDPQGWSRYGRGSQPQRRVAGDPQPLGEVVRLFPLDPDESA